MKIIAIAAILCLGITGVVTTPVFAAVLNIQDVTSPQGIKAWLVEDHSVPIIALNFQFKGAGSANDPPELQGLSQMLSNTMDEGAGSYDAKSFQMALEDHSINLHFTSSRDEFGGTLKTLTKYQDKAVELLAVALTSPHLDKEAIDRMRASNLSRIRSNMTDPDWMVARLTNSIIFKGHPYEQNSGGTLSSLPRITPDLLKKKQQTELARDNLRVSVAGDITPEKLGTLLDQLFAKLPERASVKTIQNVAITTQKDAVLYKKDIPQTVITMILPGIPMSDPDYAASEVLDFVLGSSGFGSRLTDVIREQRGLTYGIYSRFNQMDHANTLTITAATKNDSADEVIRLTKDVMNGLATNPISDKELRDAKSYLIGSIALQLTSTDNIAGTMIALQSASLPRNYLDQRAAAINLVTKDDVLRVAKRVLNTHQIQTIMVGDPKIGTPLRLVSVLPNVE